MRGCMASRPLEPFEVEFLNIYTQQYTFPNAMEVHFPLTANIMTDFSGQYSARDFKFTFFFTFLMYTCSQNACTYKILQKPL